jgi:hypothetical protein
VVKGEREGVSSSTCYSSAVTHLSNSNPTADFPRRPVDPHNLTHAHPLIQDNTSGKFDKVEQVKYVRRLPGHVLARFFKIDSGSA